MCIRDRGKSLGYGVSTFVRTHEEIAAVVDHEPYPRSVIDKAHALWIGFLKEAPGADAARKLAALRCATDDFCVHGREVYWLRHVTSSESKIAGNSVCLLYTSPSPRDRQKSR